MVQITSNKYIRGLSTNANTFSGAPGKDPYGAASNATVIADNMVLTRQRMLGNRRGFAYFTNPTSTNVDKMMEYQNVIIQHQSDNTLWHGDATTGTRTQYTGTFIPPSGYDMDGTVGRGSLFFTTTAGPMKLDSVTSTPARAGLTKGLDVRCTVTGTGAGFFGGFSKVGYHVTWLKTDANNQQVRSDVSFRTIITNNTRQTPTSITSSAGTATVTTPIAHGFTTGDHILVAGAVQTPYNGSVTITSTGTTTFTYAVSGAPASPATGTLTVEKVNNVSVAFTVPWDIPTGAYYEVWRTLSVDAANTDPGDDCFLVTKTLNAGAAGSTVTVTDTTADSILAASTPLYTNATQEGSLQNNARPPLCSAVDTYKDYTIYANASIDQTYTLNMLANIAMVSGTSAITITNTDGSGARTYTTGAAENVGTHVFQLYTGGLSNASNIENTTRSLCHVINGDSDGGFYAEYFAGPNDNPGIFRLWARSPLTGAFAITANDATMGNEFSPVLPTSGITIASSGDARQNRLFISKYQQPDAVPTLNYVDVGALDQPILRVISVRDALYVIKSDGVWYLNGQSYPFTLVELDGTCQCVSPSTAVQLNNQIFMLSNQGVVTLSLAGVTVISYDIEPVIMATILPMSNLTAISFGVAHEADRSFYLWLPSATTDTYATQCYVYHTFAQEWVRWTKPAYSGIVLRANYALYIASGLEPALLKQRRSGDKTDFSDEELAITIVSQSTTTLHVTWPSTIFTPTAGLTIHQGGNVAKVVTATHGTGTAWTFVIDWNVTYTAGAATARMPIYAHARLAPNTLGESGLVKSIYAVSYLFDTESITQLSIEVSTNEAAQMLTFPILRIVSQGWGTNPWGVVGWGDIVSPVKSVPWEIALPIPDNTGEAVSSGLIHNVSQEQFIVAQIAVSFDPDAEFLTTS